MHLLMSLFVRCLTHLDIMHAHEIAAVVQVLFKITVLEDKTAVVFIHLNLSRFQLGSVPSECLHATCTH